MRRQIIVVFFSLFFLALAPAFAGERGALFKVSAGGHTMYLFGTTHVGREDFYPLEPRIAGALERASTLALEFDPARDPAATARAFKEHALHAQGALAYRTRGGVARARLERILEADHIDLAAAMQFKPWMLAATLSIVEFVKLGYQPDLGIDQQLAKQAHAANKKVFELESAEEQAALFDRLSAEQQWQLLDETVEMIESGRAQQESREMMEAYNNADQAALDAVLAHIDSDPGPNSRFMREELLDKRNGPMADKLARLLQKEENTVAAVGVLHLLGKRGIPALLGARGLAVERVY